ncbi:MAG: hypothetical protein HY234_12240 [Acidobacteria bacterium]|nr:hypothetical protein [Acidobacteriota bacterium]
MHTDKLSTSTAADVSRRKPYVKPQCVSEKIFETTALACGKLPSGSGICAAVPKAS